MLRWRRRGSSRTIREGFLLRLQAFPDGRATAPPWPLFLAIQLQATTETGTPCTAASSL